MEQCPHLAQQVDFVPRWFRGVAQLPKGPGRNRVVHDDVLTIAEKVLIGRLSQGREMSLQGIQLLLETIINVYNGEVNEINAHLHENKESPVAINASCSESALKHLARRFARRFGYVLNANEKPGKHLAYDHPACLSLVAYVQGLIDSGKVHPQLIFNWDQVWTVLFEPIKRLLWKDPSSAGKFVDELKWFFRRKLSRSEYQKTAGLPSQMPYASPNADLDTWDVTQAKLDGYSGTSAIENWRFPRTTTTLSWIHGHLGRSFTTIPEKAMSDEKLEQANQKFSENLVIKKTGSDKHMWNCATTIQFLEFLTVELRERRLELGLAAKDGAVSICDDAEQHQNPQYLQLRKQWEKENNCILLGCDPEQRVPREAAYIHKISIYKVWFVPLQAYIHTYNGLRTYRASQPASQPASERGSKTIHTYIHTYIHSGQGVHT